MGYDVNDMWPVWSDLERKEDELKWGGRLSGVGPQFNSMGRPANASAHFNNGWASEQMGRVNRVRKALNDSGPIARNMIARTLSDIDLSTIWPILVSACQDIALYYGGSAAAGGLIGGVGGAFFGGVGAVPGAAAGAAAGGYVGGWVLAMLGLQSLVEGVAQAIPEALRCYEKGFLEAWGPTRHDHQDGFGAARGDPSFAAMHLANGHVIMISTILTALAAYVTRGKGDMLKDIRQSARLGPQVAIWVEKNEDKLRRHLALQSRGRGASPGAEPPPPKSGREPKKAQEHGASGESVRNSKIARDARADYGENNTVANNEQGMFRRSANQGAFADLPVTMDLKTVKSYANEAGVGLDGIKVRIIRDESLLDSGFTGYAHPNGKMIDLYPQAFSSPEDLVRTLGHERMHAYQARVFGPPQGSVDLFLNEKAAYGLEDSFVKYWRSRGGK